MRPCARAIGGKTDVDCCAIARCRCDCVGEQQESSKVSRNNTWKDRERARLCIRSRKLKENSFFFFRERIATCMRTWNWTIAIWIVFREDDGFLSHFHFMEPTKNVIAILRSNRVLLNHVRVSNKNRYNFGKFTFLSLNSSHDKYYILRVVWFLLFYQNFHFSSELRFKWFYLRRYKSLRKTFLRILNDQKTWTATRIYIDLKEFRFLTSRVLENVVRVANAAAKFIYEQCAYEC